MPRSIGPTFIAIAGAAALTFATSASAASWSSLERIPNDDQSATSTLGSTNVVANMAADGRAAIVFRARGNRLWVSRRNSATGAFKTPTEAFPKVRPVTNRFDVAMDGKRRLSLALGVSTKTNDALTGISGAIERSSGFGTATRISPSNGLTYASPDVVSSPAGDVYAGFSAEGAGKGGVWVERGTTASGRFSGRSTLRTLSGTTQIQPPNVEMGIANNGTLYTAFLLEDGTIATARRSTNGRWTQLPTIGLPVDGAKVDFFRMDVPSSGPAVMGIAQGGDVTVQRLTSTADAWSAPETVAGGAYTPAADLPTSLPVGAAAPSFPVMTGFDVATNSTQDVAVAWGTSGAFQTFPGVGVLFGGENAQIRYSRVMRTRDASAWPTATTTEEPAYEAGLSSFALRDVTVEMDNDRRAVVAYTSAGATQGNDNPLAVATWNGTSARAWSATQEFSRFCDTSGSVVGPSLATGGTRGVVVAWGCASSAPSANFAPRLILTRSFR